MAENLYKKTRQLLLAAGCYFVRQGKGNHEIWHSPKTDKRFTVPTKLVRHHTANSALKDAGLPKAF